MCNKGPIEKSIKEKMPGYEVKHGCGLPFMVWSEVDGKKSTVECAPMYFNCPAPASQALCKGALDKTAENAKAAGGAPPGVEMER